MIKKPMIPPLPQIIILFFIVQMFGASTSAVENQLKDNPSPYLAMHASDPVQWQPWGKQALQRARQENRLIFVSIGYFSCHWCHVMQRESYADKEVGAFLNKHFIAVKVDRELRPELDRRMIQFVEAVRGQAGWPLNVFITPDGYPVTGFTYLPRDNFLQVLLQLQTEWSKRRDEIARVAREYFEQTESSATQSSLIAVSEQNRRKIPDLFIAQAMSIADELQGGFGDTTKFPVYPQLNALLQLVASDPQVDPDVTHFLQLTLDNMASRHLMGHIDSGFFRYATDPDWQTPHYEKMLYDNAQLASLYLDADLVWPGRGYADIGLRTLDFMQQFLLDPDGGYNASLSAVDENNIEGGGYLWSKQELQQALNEKEYAHLQAIWKLDDIRSASFLPRPLVGIGADTKNPALNRQILQKLQRVKKSPMPVDRKRLVSWNALALVALVKAQAVDDSPQRKSQMQMQYQYMRDQFIRKDAQGALQVVRFAGQHQSAETTLEDYAQLARAFQRYAEHSGDVEAQQLALRLAHQAFARYFREQRWFQNNASLIPGDKGALMIQDAVLQAPDSLLLQTVLAMPQADDKLREQARQLITRLTRDVLDTPYYYATAILLASQQAVEQKASKTTTQTETQTKP